MDSYLRRPLSLALLLFMLATITIGMQSWLGDETIYSKQLEKKREAFHFAILANKAPGGASWADVGALSIQKRIGIVYLAEAVRKLSGFAVGKIYKLLDSLFLYISLVGFYFYLRRWVPDIYCLLGTLYFSAALPLTYFFQLFHPWDRIQLALWIGLLYLLAEGKLVPLAIGLAVSILVKFDTVLLPFLYLLVHFSREQWQRRCMESAALLVLAFGTYVALGKWFPAPLDSAGFNWPSAHALLLSNAHKLVEMNVRFPPLLVHALPIFLSLLFLKNKARFVWSSVIFALGLNVVYIMFSNYEEVRAHMVILVLVMPSALISLKCLLESPPLETGERSKWPAAAL